MRWLILTLCCGLPLALGTGCQTSETAPEPPPPEVETIPETPPAAAATDTAGAETTTAEPATASPAASAAPPVVGTTADERIEALDQALEDSYGEHDAMLREQQASLRTEAAAIAAQQAGGSGTDPEQDDFEQGELYQGLPGFGTPPPESAPGSGGGGGEVTAADSEDGGAIGSAQTVSGARAVEGQPGGAGVPADIPDGRDDDIVARQLREAAQMEKDPQQREKLWDEYRKYKNQQVEQ